MILATVFAKKSVTVGVSNISSGLIALYTLRFPDVTNNWCVMITCRQMETMVIK